MEQLFRHLVRADFTAFDQQQLDEFSVYAFWRHFNILQRIPGKNVHETEILQMKAVFLWGMLGGREWYA